jgi:hypothetical protein
MAFGDEVEAARQQLARVLGEPKASEVLDECFREAHLARVDTAQQLLDLAEALMKRGGFIEVIGRFLKVRALLGGAHVQASR